MKLKNMCLVSAFSVVFALRMVPTVSAVEVGEKAPDFELLSTQGGKLKQNLSRLQLRQELTGLIEEIQKKGSWFERLARFFGPQ